MPEPYENAYLDMLAEARAIYEDDLLPDLLQDLYADYLRALDDIIEGVATGTIYGPRGDELRDAILIRLAELAELLGLSGDGAMVTAMELVVGGHELGTQAAMQAAGVSVGYSFAGVPQEALELMMARRGLGLSSTFKTLINRHLDDLAPELDSLLTRHRAIGLNARQSAKEIADLLGARDPAVQEMIRQGNVRITSNTRRIISDLVDEEDVKRAKSLLFDSYRIAVTETNVAYFEADRVASARSPVVSLVQWALSGRHAGLPSSPDSCDICAEVDAHGFGPGIYHPETCPPHQHPFCQCSTIKILRRPSEWDTPPPEIPGQVRLVSSSDASGILQRAANNYSRKITPRHIERQMEAANNSILRAHNVVQEALAEV